MAKHPLEMLTESLEPYNRPDLLAIVAALHLMPENADQSLILEALTQAIASLEPKNQDARISLTRFRGICTSRVIEELRPFGDPYNNIFTESLSFFGGGYIVFPGILDDSAYILRQVNRALFLLSDQYVSPEFLARAAKIVSASLALSNEVARRAGLSRGVEPLPRDKEPIIIPHSHELQALKNAVSFAEAELISLLESHNTNLQALEAISADQGSLSASDFGIQGGGSISRTPVIRFGSQWVVALPGALLYATWIALIRLATEMQMLDGFVHAYKAAVWDSSTESLKLLNHQPIPLPLENDFASDFTIDGFFSLDTDKLLHVLLIVDPLTDYDPNVPHGVWSVEPVMEKVENRIAEVDQFVQSLTRRPDKTLTLVLIQGFGRAVAIGRKGPGEQKLRVDMSAANLETISMVEAGEHLALYKYACARDRLHETSEVICFSELDKYAAYKENGHSFYLGDDGPFNLVSFYPDYGRSLRFEVAKKLDWHPVASYRVGGTVEVGCLHSTKSVPLYFERGMLQNRMHKPAIFVEGLPSPLWVVGIPLSINNDRTTKMPLNIFVEAIAYWLWQLSPSLIDIFSQFNPKAPVIIRVTIRDSQAALPPDEQKSAANDWFSSKGDFDNQTLSITIGDNFSYLVGTADNSGERLLLAEVLDALKLLLAEHDRKKISPEFKQAVIDRHAPLGRKKKLLSFSPGYVPSLDPSGLPDRRLVQEADVNEMLDALGPHLSTTLGLGLGKIDDSRRNEVFNKSVEFYYNSLAETIKTLKPTRLLENLVAQHECLLFNIENSRMNIPGRLECFSNLAEMTELIAKELPNLFKASIATRFLIEFVVAQPPDGSKALSEESYDRLLAFASDIVNFGQLSDIVRYDIAPMPMAMLPSGRLGTGRDGYEQAVKAFKPVQAGGEIARAINSHRKYWPEVRDQQEKPKYFDQFDAACKAEFGFGHDRIEAFLHESLAFGHESDPAVFGCLKNQFVESISRRLSCPEADVDKLLKMFSLEARPQFLSPKPPFKKEDVYPWRFNRELSYLRRPFLLRQGTDGIEVVYGIRHLYATHENLVGLCLSGRLRAQSQPMKAFASLIANDQGENFNDQVAEIFRRDPKLIVRARLRRVSQKKGELEKLGDIDVFLILESKKKVFVVECKNLEGARTPFELGNEIQTFFMSKEGKQSIVDKHLRRVAWIQHNLDFVLADFRIQRKGKWEVGSFIVIDRELLSPFLKTSPVKIFPVEQLRAIPKDRMKIFFRDFNK